MNVEEASDRGALASPHAQTEQRLRDQMRARQTQLHGGVVFTRVVLEADARLVHVIVAQQRQERSVFTQALLLLTPMLNKESFLLLVLLSLRFE